MGLAWRWTSRQRADARLRGFEDTVPGQADTAAPSSTLRFEVCPPSLFDEDDEPTASRLRALLPRLSGVRHWLHTGWSHLDDIAADKFSVGPAAIGKRLHKAQWAFVAALQDQSGAAARSLLARACTADSLRELWHLRNELFTLVAVSHCESVAQQRLAELDACFATRSRHPAPSALPRAVGRTIDQRRLCP